MRAVVQRVNRASVTVDDQVVGRIGDGLLVYVAAAPDDADDDIRYIADKVAGLRVFQDEAGKMNRSVADLSGGPTGAVTGGPTGDAGTGDAAVRGGVLVVSAFTVLADARGGRRPSFIVAARPEVAQPLIDRLVAAIRAAGLRVETGRFAAHMLVESVNDGPICVLLDSRRAV